MAFMLRLKGESDDATRDDRLRADLEDQDQITSQDAFPDFEDGVNAEGSGRPTLPLRGLAIAGATFIPTFLLVFFGVPYLLSPDGPIHSAVATVRSASESPPAEGPPAHPAPVTPSEPTRSGSANRTAANPPPSTSDAPKAADATPPAAVQTPLPPVSSPSRSTQAPPERRAPEATPEPSLPPAPRHAASPHRPSQEARSSREARSGSQARSDSRAADSRVVDAKPAAGREGGDWTPAAAFTDRAAASRLASSIEKQGYPVEIRQDGSSTRPWVVWIGAQPSGGSRRR